MRVIDTAFCISENELVWGLEGTRRGLGQRLQHREWRGGIGNQCNVDQLRAQQRELKSGQRVIDRETVALERQEKLIVCRHLRHSSINIMIT